MIINEKKHINVINNFFKNNYNKIFIFIFLVIILTFVNEDRKHKKNEVYYSTYHVYFNKTTGLNQLLHINSLSSDFFFFLSKIRFEGDYDFYQKYGKAVNISFKIIHNSKDDKNPAEVKKLKKLIEDYKSSLVYKINVKLAEITRSYNYHLKDITVAETSVSAEVLNYLTTQKQNLRYFRNLLLGIEKYDDKIFVVSDKGKDHVLFHFHNSKILETTNVRQSLTKNLILNLLISFFAIILLLWFKILIWEFRKH